MGVGDVRSGGLVIEGCVLLGITVGMGPMLTVLGALYAVGLEIESGFEKAIGPGPDMRNRKITMPTTGIAKAPRMPSAVHIGPLVLDRLG